MRTKAETNTYHMTALAVLRVHNAEATPQGSSYDYKVNTAAGELLIQVGDDGCVCTRFTDVEKAKNLNLGDRLNPYSGKWNWMGGLNHDEDLSDLLMFSEALKKIT